MATKDAHNTGMTEEELEGMEYQGDLDDVEETVKPAKKPARKTAKLPRDAYADSLTIVQKEPEADYKGPTVMVFLPEIEGTEDGGMKVDQYEHVTIANEDGEKIYRIHRGEPVEVPVPVFIALKEKYGKRL